MLTESVVDANSPSHSLLSLDSREHLGRVLESDWSFAQRVADSKEIDESSQRKQSVDTQPLQKSSVNLQDNWSNLRATATRFFQKR